MITPPRARGVPVIDIGAFVSACGTDSARREAATQILRAATTTGVFQIVNHGLSPAARRYTTVPNIGGVRLC